MSNLTILCSKLLNCLLHMIVSEQFTQELKDNLPHTVICISGLGCEQMHILSKVLN